MEKMLKQIDDMNVTLKLTLEEALELKGILESKKIKRGIPTDSGNKCPVCKAELIKGNFYCGCCGQRVLWTDSDTIPL